MAKKYIAAGTAFQEIGPIKTGIVVPHKGSFWYLLRPQKHAKSWIAFETTGWYGELNLSAKKISLQRNILVSIITSRAYRDRNEGRAARVLDNTMPATVMRTILGRRLSPRHNPY